MYKSLHQVCIVYRLPQQHATNHACTYTSCGFILNLSLQHHNRIAGHQRNKESQTDYNTQQVCRRRQQSVQTLRYVTLKCTNR